MAEKSRIVGSYKSNTNIPQAFAAAARAQDRMQRDAIRFNTAAGNAVLEANARKHKTIAEIAENARNMFMAKRKQGNIERGQDLGRRMIEKARDTNTLAAKVEQEEFLGLPFNLTYNADEANKIVGTHNKVYIANTIAKAKEMSEMAAMVPEKRQETLEQFQGLLEGIRDNVGEVDPDLLTFVDEIGGNALLSLQGNIRLANHKDRVRNITTDFWNTTARDLEVGANSYEDWEEKTKKLNSEAEEIYQTTGSNPMDAIKEKKLRWDIKTAKNISDSLIISASDDITPLLNERSDLSDSRIVSPEEMKTINTTIREATTEYVSKMADMGIPVTDEDLKGFRRGILKGSIRLFYENSVNNEMRGMAAGEQYDAQVVEDKFAKMYAIAGDLIEEFAGNIEDPVEASVWEEEQKQTLNTYMVQKKRELSTIAAGKKLQRDGEALRKWRDVLRNNEMGLPTPKEDWAYLRERTEPNTAKWLDIEDAEAFSSGATIGADVPLINSVAERRNLEQLLADRETAPSVVNKVLEGFDKALEKRYELGDTYYQWQRNKGMQSPITTTTEIDKMSNGDPVKAAQNFIEQRRDKDTNKIIIAPNDWPWLESLYGDAVNDKDPAKQRLIISSFRQLMPQVYEQFGQTETGWLGAVSVADELALPVPHYTEPAILDRFRNQNKDKINAARDTLLRKMPAGHQGRKLADYFLFSVISKHAKLLPDNGKWLSDAGEFDAGDLSDDLDQLVENADNILIKGVGFADTDTMNRYYDAYYAANPEQKLIAEEEAARHYSPGDKLISASRFTDASYHSQVFGDNVKDLVSDTGDFYLKQGRNMGDPHLSENVKARIEDGHYVLKVWDINNNNTVYKLFTPEGEALSANNELNTIIPVYAVFPRSTAAK